MSVDILTLITVFVLAAFVGFEVISKVPSILHTPLMSGTNAIHGVILVGGIIVLGTARGTAELALGFVAVVLATLSSQLPPLSAARSTMTLPGAIARTISAVTRTGALRPGMAAVVITASAAATSAPMSSRWRRRKSSDCSPA